MNIIHTQPILLKKKKKKKKPKPFLLSLTLSLSLPLCIVSLSRSLQTPSKMPFSHGGDGGVTPCVVAAFAHRHW